MEVPGPAAAATPRRSSPSCWNRHDVAAPENLTKRLRHPELGPLQFTYTNLWLSQRMGVRLVTYTPDDPETETKLDPVPDLGPQPLLVAA